MIDRKSPQRPVPHTGCRRLSALVLLVTAFLCAAADAAAPVSENNMLGDWPQFLGPQRNGISTETGILDEWPEGGPKILWRARGGVGMSGLAIRDGRLFTLIQRDRKQWLSAYDAQSGASL